MQTGRLEVEDLASFTAMGGFQLLWPPCPPRALVWFNHMAKSAQAGEHLNSELGKTGLLL